MHPLHYAYFVARCWIRDGYIQGSIAKQVTNISSERACAVYVKQQYPEASGATLYNSTCWAEFGENIVHSSSHQTCRFEGTFYQFYPR